MQSHKNEKIVVGIFAFNIQEFERLYFSIYQ